jgi:hypothetical protein
VKPVDSIPATRRPGCPFASLRTAPAGSESEPAVMRVAGERRIPLYVRRLPLLLVMGALGAMALRSSNVYVRMLLLGLGASIFLALAVEILADSLTRAVARLPKQPHQ